MTIDGTKRMKVHIIGAIHAYILIFSHFFSDKLPKKKKSRPVLSAKMLQKKNSKYQTVLFYS